jgi:hypothetical protein
VSCERSSSCSRLAPTLQSDAARTSRCVGSHRGAALDQPSRCQDSCPPSLALLFLRYHGPHVLTILGFAWMALQAELAATVCSNERFLQHALGAKEEVRAEPACLVCSPC